MTFAYLRTLLPLLVLSAAGVAVLLAIAARRHHGAALALTLAGLAATVACAADGWSAGSPGGAARQVTDLLALDRFALFFIGLSAAAAFLVALWAHSYLERRGDRREEFYVLLVLATAGAGVLAACTHFASFFLGLELLTVSLYGLVAYHRGLLKCVEAGVKYLVLAGVSSAFLLFGMALVYADQGTMRLAALAEGLAACPPSAWVLAGLAMMLVGVGFKLAVVPFHLWTPDVYEGAPAPVTAFVATVSKGAIVAVLLRMLWPLQLGWGVRILPAALAAIAAASMFVGNLLALRQNNVKRVLAYSSIAHLGYVLVALLAAGASGPAGSRDGASAVAFYLAAYFVTTLGAFGVVAVLSGPGGDAEDIEEYRGLLWRRPELGGVMTAMLMSLAGIPLTAGFVAKFYVLRAGVGAEMWGLLGALVVSSVIGLYYYLRIVVSMARRPATDSPAAAGDARRLPATASVALSIVAIALVWLGVFPGPMIDLVRGVFHAW